LTFIDALQFIHSIGSLHIDLYQLVPSAPGSSSRICGSKDDFQKRRQNVFC